MRAMILAAGHGTRLRPMTEVLPKPLLPIANLPQLRYQLELLRRAGITEVVINVHHLAGAIPNAMGDGSAIGMRITYSREPVILGTGGGIKACGRFLTAGAGPFVVINGDVLIDFSLRDALETHRRSGAAATMVLRDDPRASFFGAIGVDAGGRIIDFVGRARVPGVVARQGLFTGIHVMEPEVLEYIPEGPCGINETAYPEMIRRGLRIQAHFQRGYWSDVGTPSRYLEANAAVLGQRLERLEFSAYEQAAWGRDGAGEDYGDPETVERQRDVEVIPPVLLGTGAIMESGARVGPFVVLGPEARVGRHAEVSHAVVWAGAAVEECTRAKRVVFWRRGGQTEPLFVEPTGGP